MIMKKMRKNKNRSGRYRLLAAAVLAALGASLPVSGEAYTTSYIPYGGKNVAEVTLLAKGEHVGVVDEDGDYSVADKAQYNLDPSLAKAMHEGMQYWTDMLGPKGKVKQPWQIFVTTKEKYQNASAGSTSLSVAGPEAKGIPDSYVAKLWNEGKVLNHLDVAMANKDEYPYGNYAYSEVSIGQNFGAAKKDAIDGWWVDADTPVPTNEQAADYMGTIRHELGHALGLSLRWKTSDAKGDVSESKVYNGRNELYVMVDKDLTGAREWTMNLYDQNLNQAKPGMQIITTQTFNEIKKANPGAKQSDYFIVDNKETDKNLTGRKGNLYFIGDHVKETLAGATFQGVSGIPVQGWEKGEIDKNGDRQYQFEGSHLQTSGMMSHRPYSNYTSFMEVELAVMQDLGYNIDRKAYFGRSVYGDGGNITNTQGYSARNAVGTAYIAGKPSEVPLGVGLHIYGSRNTVTQAADILTNGKGGTGIRVDGMRNILIIPKETKIQADGYRGNGILIAYGRDQVVNQAGTVTAKGERGAGIRFDFGSSTNGATDEYRGSYIRYDRSVNKENGSLASAENLPLTDMKEGVYNAAADELNGPMVKAYNLSGKLEGTENAIFISRNAFVKDININEGAEIKGNITSEWKHFDTDGSYDGKEGSTGTATAASATTPGATAEGEESTMEKLAIQYPGTKYKQFDYDVYIPALVTNLNFNTDMAYSGNITGPDNMKLWVNKGTLLYGGTANVVGVHVAEGAGLFGGNYIVNDMSKKTNDDFTSQLTDMDKGNFINCGTIGPLSGDTAMNIEGSLISDGTLQGVAGGKSGIIDVSRSANINGSTVIAKNLLPDEKAMVGKALSVTGSVKNTEDKPYQFGMLNEVGAVEGNTAVVTGRAANNLGAADATQAEAYDAMMAMYNNLAATNDARVNDMRPLFTMTPSRTREALSAIASNASAKSMALAQRSMTIHHLIGSRLNDAFRTKKVETEIPVQHLDGSDDKGVPVSLTAVEPAENDIWLKFGKNWGDMREGTDYHSSTTLLGWDRAYGNNWRAGVFAGYGKTSFSDRTAGNELKDVRLGLYGGYSKGKSEGFVYLDYGWMRNKLRRGLTNLGMTAKADYHSRILELGGEYLYDLHAEKNVPWHVRPYVNAQLSRLWQNGYSETDAGPFGQVVESKQNNYFGAGLGVEFKRYLAGGSYAIRAGLKHAFAGAEPKLRYGYLGNAANTYKMRNVQDKTHFLLSIGGEVAIGKGWTIGGDAAFEQGSHDKDWSCGVTVRRMW